MSILPQRSLVNLVVLGVLVGVGTLCLVHFQEGRAVIWGSAIHQGTPAPEALPSSSPVSSEPSSGTTQPRVLLRPSLGTSVSSNSTEPLWLPTIQPVALHSEKLALAFLIYGADEGDIDSRQLVMAVKGALMHMPHDRELVIHFMVGDIENKLRTMLPTSCTRVEFRFHRLESIASLLQPFAPFVSGGGRYSASYLFAPFVFPLLFGDDVAKVISINNDVLFTADWEGTLVLTSPDACARPPLFSFLCVQVCGMSSIQ
jgi:hypothetical protein